MHPYVRPLEYIYGNDGTVDNPSFLDHRMPVCSDLTMIDTVLVEVPNPKHPQGVKGVGEMLLIPVMAAVVNAVHQALGKCLYSLPMSPAKVLEELEKGFNKVAVAGLMALAIGSSCLMSVFS